MLLEDFNNLTKQEQVKALTSLKAQVGVKKITEAWGISRKSLNTIMKELGMTIRQSNLNSNVTFCKNESKVCSTSKNDKVNDLKILVDSKKTEVTAMSIEGKPNFIRELLTYLISSPVLENTQMNITLRIDA